MGIDLGFDGVRYSIWRLDKKNAEKKCRLFSRINRQIRNSKSFNEKLTLDYDILYNCRILGKVQLQLIRVSVKKVENVTLLR